MTKKAPSTTRAAGDDADFRLPDVLPVRAASRWSCSRLAVRCPTSGRSCSVRLVDEAMKGDRLIAPVLQKNDAAPAGPSGLRRVGVVASIRR